MTVAMLLPFLGKPFHMDDPLFLWSAEQIARDPSDFYGTPVNWYGSKQRLHEVTKNPPLVSYGIAAVSRLTGFDERTLHSAFLVPAAAATVGTWFLAARLAAPPTLAALAVLASPVFLTSATSMMCDVPMLACFVWALFFWIRGLEDERPGSLYVAGALVAAAGLSKYFGVALVPLLAFHALWRERRVGVWCLALVLPVLVLAAYQWGTHELYGRGLLSDAAQYATAKRALTGENGVHTALTGLAFTGACAATLLFFLPGLLSSWRWRAAGLGAVLMLAAVIPQLGSLAGIPLRLDGTVRWGFVAQIALHAAVGVAGLALALADFARRRSADSALLLAWVFGTFVFAAFLNWTINARSVLPLMPALAILVARRLDRLGAGRLVGFVPLAPAAALALAVAAADQGMAENARHAAEILHQKYGERASALSFQGHWGFQYYMQAHGFRPLDQARSQLPIGALLARPSNNTGLFPIPGTHLRRLESFAEPLRLLTVMDRKAGAGFYTSLWGPLPYAFGDASPDRTTVFEVTRPLQFRLRRPDEP